MKEFSELFVCNGKRFILGTITIVDFYYFESSNYMLGMFRGLMKDLSQINCADGEYLKVK